MSLYFHILNRGVEKRNIVKDDFDRRRFVHDLYVMNDRSTVAHPKEKQRERTRRLLVKIHTWCLMDNHYHLLLSPIDDNLENISFFMKKLNMGYAKYFNLKYKRSGHLWQGKYKKMEIQDNSHFIYLPYYIHLNPLDKTHPEWRKGTVKNISRAFEILNNYRWSSFLDYSGKKNFSSIINDKLIANGLGSTKHQKNEIIKLISKTGFELEDIQLET